MNTAARIVYGLFGGVALGLGLLVLFRPEIALPPEAASPLTAHLIQEQGAEGIFIGLMSLWCLFHLQARRPVHFALLVFALIFSTLHWAEYLHARRGLASPLLNTL